MDVFEVVSCVRDHHIEDTIYYVIHYRIYYPVCAYA